MRQRLGQQLLLSRNLQRMLGALGAASSPSELGVSADRLRADLLSAREIRRRYTVLDLAAEVGLLEPLVDEVVAASSSHQRSAPASPPVAR
jgi:glycerol-1-phosphate dehydrogenase [NAD(P)+]